jgi:threonylcarbamoyladenosine tRNA methylthiotransferase MtaB
LGQLRVVSVDVIDFGCRLNIAEGAAIARHLAGGADRIVINSCAVTGEAVRQARQAVRRAGRARPGVPITVTGCGAVTDGATFAAMPEVTDVVAKAELRHARPAVSGDGHARAFIEVQNGCDHDCTFCVTTLARGAARSQPVADVVAEVAAAVTRGHREVVLTGVDLTSYRPSLAVLVKTILRDVPELPRLRLSSLDPAEVDDKLFDLLAYEPRVMPHVHLSLQSGDAMILKRMRRRHSPEQAIDLVARLKAARPEIAIGADLIAGFPTETAAMHANSRAVLDACDIVFAHIFPYSPRPSTAAARMPQVAPEVARARARELREVAADRSSRWRAALIGSVLQILVERDGISGHAPNFAGVRFASRQGPGSIVAARIAGVDGDKLRGIPA